MRLRVVAGEFGGRVLEAPSGFATHPMSERMRNALFNMLGDLSGKTVLDPYAGSGAIAIEAVSRGAARAVAIERDRKAQAVIAQNIANLKLESRVQLVKANCRAWSETTFKKASGANPSPDAPSAPFTPPMASTPLVPAEYVGVNGNRVASEERQANDSIFFDLIIADPPYNDLQLSTVALLTRHLKSTGSMILSHPGRESAPTVNGVVVVDNREYGDAALAIYRKEL